MFTTGEFSKIARVTRRTLRHYRDIGLFEPVEVGADSGYHYYTMEQLPQLQRIQVRTYLQAIAEVGTPALRWGVDTAHAHGMHADYLTVLSDYAHLVGDFFHIKGRIPAFDQLHEPAAYRADRDIAAGRAVAAVRVVWYPGARRCRR